MLPLIGTIATAGAVRISIRMSLRYAAGWSSTVWHPFAVSGATFPIMTSPAGKLDGLMFGGPKRCGVLEIKATFGDGEEAQPAHVCQLGGYLALHSAWRGSASKARWGLLAYALPRSGTWKLHRFQDVARLARSASKLLAA